MKHESDLIKEVEDVFRGIFKDPKLEITLKTSNNDINGWDSLTHAILIDSIEKKFNISFDIQDMLTMHTVSDIVKKVAEKRQ